MRRGQLVDPWRLYPGRKARVGALQGPRRESAGKNGMDGLGVVVRLPMAQSIHQGREQIFVRLDKLEEWMCCEERPLAPFKSLPGIGT